MKQWLGLHQITLKYRIGGGMNLLHMQETNQPAEKRCLNAVYLRSNHLFLEKGHLPLQTHPPLDNLAVKDTAAWLMHCLQSSITKKLFQNP